MKFRILQSCNSEIEVLHVGKQPLITDKDFLFIFPLDYFFGWVCPPPHSHPFKKKIKVNDDTWLNLVLWYCLGYHGGSINKLRGGKCMSVTKSCFFVCFCFGKRNPVERTFVFRTQMYIYSICVYYMHLQL